MASNTLSSTYEKELRLFKRFQLPHAFKKLGLIILVISFVGLFLNKFTLDQLSLRAIAKYGMLVGLIIMSISKEQIEDEFIIQLRMQSYAFAFIFGVLFTFATPFIDYLADLFLGAKEATIDEVGDFEILWILLSVQVFCFEYIKRKH